MTDLYPIVRRQRRPLGQVSMEASQLQAISDGLARAEAEVTRLGQENARLAAEVERLSAAARPGRKGQKSQAVQGELGQIAPVLVNEVTSETNEIVSQ